MVVQDIQVFTSGRVTLARESLSKFPLAAISSFKLGSNSKYASPNHSLFDFAHPAFLQYPPAFNWRSNQSGVP